MAQEIIPPLRDIEERCSSLEARITSLRAPSPQFTILPIISGLMLFIVSHRFDEASPFFGDALRFLGGSGVLGGAGVAAPSIIKSLAFARDMRSTAQKIQHSARAALARDVTPRD